MLSKEINLLILAGVVLGIGALLLVYFGNPANMGLCAACFVRDISGGIGLHQASTVQYIRPEIIALAMGSFFIAIITKEYKAVSSNSIGLRFIISICVMIGALIFLGCPTRMVLRIAGGDLNAIVGLFGFILGLYIGFRFKQNGFTLGEEIKTENVNGFIFPILVFILLPLLLLAPSFIYFSQSGPASQKAPIIISFVVAFIIGMVAYKSRFCFASGLVRPLFKKEYGVILGVATFFLTVLIGNILFGNFKASFEGQPIAHSDGVFNFLGMLIVGWGSMMLVGCPFRQIIKAGSGNINSTIAILGFIVGASVAHNFSLASTPSGVPQNGQIAVFIILIFFIILVMFSKKDK